MLRSTPLPVRWGAPALLGIALLTGPARAGAQTLRGSASSLDRQSQQAHLHDFTYLRRPVQLERFVDAGILVPVAGNRDYRLSGVSFGVARPEVKRFLERLGAEYRHACGEQMVVTSLTRPTSEQPRNASQRSVHPTGMAVDLRRPSGASCRIWLESTLVNLEARRVLEATLERHPPHYHIAIFPAEYVAYLAAGPRVRTASRSSRHVVGIGETLWHISQTYGTTVAAIQDANGLMSTSIGAGQSLVIPAAMPRR